MQLLQPGTRWQQALCENNWTAKIVLEFQGVTGVSASRLQYGGTGGGAAHAYMKRQKVATSGARCSNGLGHTALARNRQMGGSANLQRVAQSSTVQHATKHVTGDRQTLLQLLPINNMSIPTAPAAPLARCVQLAFCTATRLKSACEARALRLELGDSR